MSTMDAEGGWPSLQLEGEPELATDLQTIAGFLELVRDVSIDKPVDLRAEAAGLRLAAARLSALASLVEKQATEVETALREPQR